MKIFNLIRDMLSFIGIHPRGEEEKVLNWKRSTILWISVFRSFSSTTYFLIEAKSFRGYTYSLYMSATSIFFTYCYIILICNVDRIFALIEKFEQVIKGRLENPICKPCYENMNSLIERKTHRTHTAFIKMTLPGVILPRFLISYYLYYTTDLDRDSFTLPFPMWVSFMDWHTPINFFFSSSMLSITTYFLLSCCACIISLFVGICCVFITFTTDMKTELQTLRESREETEIAAKFRDFIIIHSDIKELACEFTGLCATIITGYYLWSIITIGVTLLIVIMETSHHKVYPIEMLEPIIMMFWSFAQMFVICNFGEFVNLGFEELSDALYECDWYNFTRKLKRDMPIIMLNTQHPVLRGSGNLPCSREGFMEVINSGFEYFRIVREIGNMHGH